MVKKIKKNKYSFEKINKIIDDDIQINLTTKSKFIIIVSFFSVIILVILIVSNCI